MSRRRQPLAKLKEEPRRALGLLEGELVVGEGELQKRVPFRVEAPGEAVIGGDSIIRTRCESLVAGVRWVALRTGQEEP